MFEESGGALVFAARAHESTALSVSRALLRQFDTIDDKIGQIVAAGTSGIVALAHSTRIPPAAAPDESFAIHSCLFHGEDALKRGGVKLKIVKASDSCNAGSAGKDRRKSKHVADAHAVHQSIKTNAPSNVSKCPVLCVRVSYHARGRRAKTCCFGRVDKENLYVVVVLLAHRHVENAVLLKEVCAALSKCLLGVGLEHRNKHRRVC